ncbi:MAG: tetratricopeptide repeat protein [Bacteroidales bacterium]|nr:tetratricopeptide repeat protein [Bacteroidales bacterium]
MIKTKYLLILFTFLLTNHTFSQNYEIIDSLNQQLLYANHDTTKVSTLLYLGDQFTSSNFNKAIEYYNKALSIAKKIPDFSNAPDNKNLGILHASCYNSLGIVFFYQGEYSKALQHFQKSANIKEQYNITEKMPWLNMGIVNFEIANYQKALQYFNQHLNFYTQNPDNVEVGNALCWIGNLNLKQEKFDLAIDYYNQYYNICSQYNDVDGMSMAASNTGTAYIGKNQYTKALEYLQKSLQIDIENKNYRGVAISYSNIGKVYKKKNDYNQAIKYYSLAINHAIELNALPLLLDFYQNITEAYEEMADYKKALGFLRLHFQVKDSLLNLEKTQKIQEVEAKYGAEKKQLENQNLKKEAQLQKAENKRQRTILISLFAGLAALIIFLFFIFRLFLQKKKAHRQISEKNIQLTMANEEIKTQKEEIEAQRDEIALHRDTVVLQKTEIEDSIKYAKRIQNAVMPQSKNAELILNKHFIIFKPKDVVSGDFFWAAKTNNHLIITVADCTGHGVPGAFMSMLGITFLNEIIRKKEILNPSIALNQIRTSVIEALQQEQEKENYQFAYENMKDGMDMSLAIINLKTKNCLWAGANLPLWIQRKNNPEILEIKPNKMPVGIYPIMNDFSTHEIKLNPGDRLYLFSDGMPDQFGGPTTNGRKFKYAALKNLISQNHLLPLNQQKEIIEQALENWMFAHNKPFNQTDDITILGFEID